MSRKISILILTVLVLAACGEHNNSQSVAQERAALAETPKSNLSPDPILPIVVEEVPPPETCSPAALKISNLSVDALDNIREQWVDCDPLGKYFELDGRVRQYWYGDIGLRDYNNASANVLQNMQSMSRAIADTRIFAVFQELPLRTRQQVLEAATPILVEYVTGFVHKDEIDRFLLNVTWEEVEKTDPNQYHFVEWPVDRNEPIDVDGYGNVSKIDFWARMFWKRRGEFIFTHFKTAFQEHYDESSNEDAMDAS